jgi:hypothetical protein
MAGFGYTGRILIVGLSSGSMTDILTGYKTFDSENILVFSPLDPASSRVGHTISESGRTWGSPKDHKEADYANQL